MKKINILQVLNVRFYNATAWYAFFLSKTLCEMGHNSTVLTLEGTISGNKADEMGIQRIALPYDQKKIANLAKIYSFIDKQLELLQPDIVNCHRGELYPLFVHFKNKYGYKLVRTRGDQRKVKKNIINSYFYKQKSDALIASNNTIKNELINTLLVDEKKVSAILGGVDTKVFYPNKNKRDEVRAQFGYTPNDCVVGLLGRLDPIKGQKESILAMAELVHTHKITNLKLCIIGFDELYLKSSELYPLIAEHNLQDYVQITGKVSDVNAVLNMCDAAILPSIGSEAIARAAFEFMACDVPLISSNVGIMPDITISSARFETGNISEMSQFLKRIALAFSKEESTDKKDAQKWIEEIREAQRALLPEISLENFAKKTLEVYTTLLNQGK